MGQGDAVLVLNAGSSSIKFSLFDQPRNPRTGSEPPAMREDGASPSSRDADGADLTLVAGGQVSGIYTAPAFVAKDAAGQTVGEKRWASPAGLGHEGALAHLMEWIQAHHGRDHRLAAVGHRVVHGGRHFVAPTRLDAAVVAKLETLVPLAPLHQPHNLAPIRTLLARAPELPQIACFDTAMHRTFPRVEQMFALPPEWEEEGVRRYGLHGLSYEYIATALPSIDARAAAGKTVVLHLGNGASMCALSAGRSVASTMGLTGVDGLPMGTRSGALDPGVMLYLMQQRGMDARAIESLIYTKSGLLGVSGVSSDMRALLASPEPRAALAVELFVYRIGRELGSLAAALSGLDAIVFTGGIGEHAAPVRARVCQGAGWLGVALDAKANDAGGPRISTAESRTSAWVIPTNEELVIARHTRALLAGG